MNISRQNSGANKEKYEQKDSLYIDVGQPLFNGKTDTLNGGVNSKNSSLLLTQNPSNGSNNVIPSKFAQSGRKDAKARGGDLFKAAIMNSRDRNASSFSADSDIESPTKKTYEASSFKERSNAVMNQQKKEDSDNTDEFSGDNAQIDRNAIRISTGTSDKHPSRVSTTKRYSMLEGKTSTGNSPTYSPGFGSPKKNSKYAEEAKSPTK